MSTFKNQKLENSKEAAKKVLGLEGTDVSWKIQKILREALDKARRK